MAAPVADSFVGGILQGGIARGDGYYMCPQHLHLFYVDMLAFDVGLPHEDHTLHAGQGADGSGRHTVLSGTGLGNDAPLAHAAGQ